VLNDGLEIDFEKLAINSSLMVNVANQANPFTAKANHQMTWKIMD
jgi:hypothetical protein